MSLPLPPHVSVPDKIAWVNGAIVRGEAAALSLFDRGARDGEGIFETLRIYGGRPFGWERHMERLVLSAAELGFPVPPAPAKARAALDELLEATALTDAVMRYTVTRGIPGGRPTLTGAWMELESLASRLWAGERQGAARVVFSITPFEPGGLGRHKTTSRLAYALAREEARARGAHEALLVSTSGHALEGAASNLFVVADGAVVTPPLARGILPGITRAIVLGLCAELGFAVREAMLTVDQVREADEVFLTNSVQQVLPVSAIDGSALGAHPTALRLRAAYQAYVTEALARQG